MAQCGVRHSAGVRRWRRRMRGQGLPFGSWGCRCSRRAFARADGCLSHLSSPPPRPPQRPSPNSTRAKVSPPRITIAGLCTNSSARSIVRPMGTRGCEANCGPTNCHGCGCCFRCRCIHQWNFPSGCAAYPGATGGVGSVIDDHCFLFFYPPISPQHQSNTCKICCRGVGDDHTLYPRIFAFDVSEG